MLKNKKDHFVPEFGGSKKPNFKMTDTYDDMYYDNDPIELGKERIEVIKDWLKRRSDIQGALLIGSYARGEQREDSDVDFLFVVDDPKKWVKENSWCKVFGPVVSQTQTSQDASTSLSVYYKDDVEMEFIFVTRAWFAEPYSKEVEDILKGGHKVLLENKELFAHLKK